MGKKNVDGIVNDILPNENFIQAHIISTRIFLEKEKSPLDEV